MDLWLIYAATLSPVSIAGICTEVFNLSSIGVYYFRMWRAKKKIAAAE